MKLIKTPSIYDQVGIPVLENKGISNVFKESGLDWKVEQKPLYSEYGNVNLIANYREDNHKLLGVVSPNYRVVQNVEAFNFVDKLNNFTLEKVGMFGGGKKVYVVGKSNENFSIDSNDSVDIYFTFLHGHDAATSIRFIVCPIRMACMNQLNLMLHSATYKYCVKHIGNIELKLKEVHKAVDQSHSYTSALEDTVKQMITTKLDTPVDKLVLDLIPVDDNDSESVKAKKEDIRETILTLYNDKDDLQNYKGTHFGFLSAVSDYISHNQPQKVFKDGNTMDNMFIKNLNGNSLLERTHLLLAA